MEIPSDSASMFIRIIFAAIVCCVQPPAADAWQVDRAQPSATAALAEEATRLQNSGKFAEAANQWEKIIGTQPDWPRIGVAYLNLGVCKVSQGKFTEAFEPIKKSLQLSGNRIDTPKALMFLGYAQMNHGNQLSLSKEPSDLEAASVYLTTATQTLGKILNNFPDFELADQALYFRGQSFYKLDRLNEAISAFEKVAQDKDATFRKDALFDMASAYQRQGELTLAKEALDDYYSIASDQAAENPAALDDVRLRTAKALLGLAKTADDQNTDSAEHYANVIELLQPIADDPQSDLKDQALFNQALAEIGLNNNQAAASMLETVAALPGSSLSQQSAVLAGRAWSQLQQYDRAIELLRPIAESNSRFGIEAAILLSTALRMTDQPESAIVITQRWAQTDPDSPLIVALLMEQADATYMVRGKKKEAAKLYTTIALDYPPSSATGDALYKAAAAHWETFATIDAIAMARQFIDQFPNHPRVPAAQTILADAAIAKENFAEGESIYRDLVRDYPEDPDVGQWTLRIGWALFLQDKFASASDFLKTSVDTIKRLEDQSEAFHWIGESAFELKNYRDAIRALNQALESAKPWERLDATLFTRLQAELALGKFEDALVSLNLLQQKFPDSEFISESLLRTGEAYLEHQKFPDAIAQYKKVINQYPDSEYLPSAMYGLGWAQLRGGQFETAEATFDKLIADFPTINLSQQARVGRSIAQRRLGKTDSAIVDLIAFIESAAPGERKNNSMLELGLAYVENENWQEAKSTFTELLAVEPTTSLADRAHYELAWVLRRLDEPQAALDQFQQLINEHPNSDLAAEAFFEVAADLYQRKNFEAAAPMFQRSLDANVAVSPLEEKALYQLAWSHYHLKDFAAAAKSFGTLVTKFPQSDRIGDALFMQGQSHFQLDQFAESLEAYQAAKERLNGSNADQTPQKRLLMLHGAQSANQVGEFQTALNFATPLTLTALDEGNGSEAALVHSAWLEIAKARLALGEIDGAMDGLERASKDLGKTGAQARVMKGDLLLESQAFEAAINEYKLVFYGYGGTKSTDEIRALQAYAIYETARASYIRIADASPRLKPEFIDRAIQHFRYLVGNYPDQPLAQKATKQIQALQKLQQDF